MRKGPEEVLTAVQEQLGVCVGVFVSPSGCLDVGIAMAAVRLLA